MNPAVVIISPGFHARGIAPHFLLVGRGIEAVEWLQAHRKEVTAFLDTLTANDIGRYVDLPLPDKPAPRMRRCDSVGCEDAIEWHVFAAYAVDSTLPHPTLARYSAPMRRVCSPHLAEAMTDDAITPGTTGGFYVEPSL